MSLRHLTLALTVASGSLAAGCPATPPQNVFTAAQHQNYFPIDVGAMHELGKPVVGGASETITCDGCHGGGTVFAEYYCLNCHGTVAGTLEDAHALVDAFERDSHACFACHSDGLRGTHIEPPPPPPEPGVDAGPPAYDHDTDAFPISSGTPHSPDSAGDYIGRATEQGLTHCTACHASSTDRTLTRCAECHASDEPSASSVHPAGVVRTAFDAVDDCKQCHWTTPTPSALSKANHDAASCMDHFGARCFNCHDQEQLQGQPKEWAIDFTMGASPVECNPCHTGEPRPYPQPCN